MYRMDSPGHTMLPLVDVMGIPSENREVFRNLFRTRATTISEQLGVRPEFDELVNNFSKGFEEVFNMELEPSEYTVQERKMADWFVENKYGNDDWNLKM